MTITDKTVFTQRPIMFLDGENGGFIQKHDLLVEGEDTDITLQVDGGKDIKTTRVFSFKGEVYQTIKDVLIAAGYKWEVSER